MNKLYIFFLLLIFSNCKNESPQYSKNTTPLFDLKGFLDNEIATHLKDIKKVKKTVTVNGKTETKEVEIKDWKEELKPFFNSDINRPAWRDKYKILNEHNFHDYDTLVSKKQFNVIDKNLKTQRINIYYGFKTEKTKPMPQTWISSVSIFNLDNSAISQSYQILSYDENGYTIISKQKLIGGQEEKIKIGVTFPRDDFPGFTGDLEKVFSDLIPH
jgi:hypothetical protein